MVEVILLERIGQLGQIGDVVRVRPGFARNFLLPQNKALRATQANRKAFEGRRSQLLADNLQRREEAEKAAVRMQGVRIPVVRQSGESGQLYGSVTSRDIVAALGEAGITVSRSQVVIGHAIKQAGLHKIRIALHPEVSVLVTLAIAKTLEEAQARLDAIKTGPEKPQAGSPGEGEAGGEEAAVEAAPEAAADGTGAGGTGAGGKGTEEGTGSA